MWCPETESYRQPRWADTLWRRAKKSPITKDEALFNVVPGDRIVPAAALGRHSVAAGKKKPHHEG